MQPRVVDKEEAVFLQKYLEGRFEKQKPISINDISGKVISDLGNVTLNVMKMLGGMVYTDGEGFDKDKGMYYLEEGSEKTQLIKKGENAFFGMALPSKVPKTDNASAKKLYATFTAPFMSASFLIAGMEKAYADILKVGGDYSKLEL